MPSLSLLSVSILTILSMDPLAYTHFASEASSSIESVRSSLFPVSSLDSLRYIFSILIHSIKLKHAYPIIIDSSIGPQFYNYSIYYDFITLISMFS